MDFRYKDIITVNQERVACVDLLDEKKNYWRSFIPTETFKEALMNVVDSLDRPVGNDGRKSFWMQGQYGTGKSHATSVIKHLLSESIDEIGSYIDNLKNPELITRLMKLRRSRKYFTVQLKASSGIADHSDIPISIQQAVMKSLADAGLEPALQTHFDSLIEIIQQQIGHTDWNQIIQNEHNLSQHVTSVDELIAQLRNGDVSLLKKTSQVYRDRFGAVPVMELTDYLKQLSGYLQENGYNGLLILWDEFTPVLRLGSLDMTLSVMQSIAELSRSHEVFIYLISHRSMEQVYGADKLPEDFQKVMDRFVRLDFRMNDLTTYTILNHFIIREDEGRWKELREESFSDPKVRHSLIQIAGTDRDVKAKNLLEIFPFHPYSAYLSNHISGTMGSAERSIFDFMQDRKKGFIHFITNNPTDDADGVLLTPDCLLDYFIKKIESAQREVLPVTRKYRDHVSTITDPHTLRVFKALILLNYLHKSAGFDESRMELISPHRDNLTSCFSGTNTADHLDAACEWLREQRIFNVTPRNYYLVEQEILPQEELSKEARLLREQLDIDRMHMFNDQQVKNLIEIMGTDSILRETDVRVLIPRRLTKEVLIQKLGTVPENSKMQIRIYLGRSDPMVHELQKVIHEISDMADFQHIAFLILDKPIPEDVVRDYIDYMSRVRVAQRHSVDSESDKDYAIEVVSNWINQQRNSRVHCIWKGQGWAFSADKAGKGIQDEIIPNVFSKGFEKLRAMLKTSTLWKTTRAQKTSEYFLTAVRLPDLESKLSGYAKQTTGILKTNHDSYIILDSLSLLPEADTSHPLVGCYHQIKQTLDTIKGIAHLGKELKHLTSPPYGLFPNQIHYAALGFCFRFFKGKLYGTSGLLKENQLNDLIKALFDYWEKEKDNAILHVRMGSEEEKELKELLNSLLRSMIQGMKDRDQEISHELDSEREDLTAAQIAFRNIIRENETPFWVYAFKQKAPVQEAIGNLQEFINSTDQRLDREEITKIVNAIKYVKTDLIQLLKYDAREIFRQWLASRDKQLNENSVQEEFSTYLHHHMPEEKSVESWNESDVESKIDKWKLSKLEKERSNEESRKLGEIGQMFQFADVTGISDFILKMQKWQNEHHTPLWLLALDGSPVKEFVGELSGLLNPHEKDDRKSARIEKLKQLHATLTREQVEFFKETDHRIKAWHDYFKGIENQITNSVIDPFLEEYLEQRRQWDSLSMDQAQKEFRQWRDDKEKTERNEQLLTWFKQWFGINPVDLTRAREEIRKWVSDSGLPFWIFRYKNPETEGWKELISAIHEYLKNPNPHDHLQAIHTQAVPVMKKMKAVHFSRDMAKTRYFPEWLREQKMEDDFNPEEALTIIKAKMDTDASLWSSEKMLNKLYESQREKREKEKEENQKQARSKESKEKKEKLKKKIESNPTKILHSLIDRYPEALKWIEIVLQDMEA